MKISLSALSFCIAFLIALCLFSWLHFHDAKGAIVVGFAIALLAWLGRPWWKGALEKG